MTKLEIMEELDIIYSVADSNDNTLICNKVKRIQETLRNEWDLSDFYMDLLKKELYYNETNTQV
jgi:hypothetical protein